jgi:tripartite ATP-independent transporter DctM subunit
VYVLLTDKNIPAIPLFAFVGFILAESKAGDRLMRLFRALLGFMPGGIVIMVVLVSAYFTTFTGASGITILALGSILFVALSKKGSYSENFSIGLLTASGSIGLLFPPSLPLILYGSIAQISILEMFKAGIIPGVIMIVVMSATGIILSLRKHIAPVPFRPKEVLKCLKESVWEIVIPAFVIIPFFIGITKLVETAAFIVVYTLIVEVVIHREIKWRDLPNVALRGIIIMGGVLVIIGTAQALADYIVDQEIPMLLAAWMKQAIQSPLIFLLILNIALLISGCLMEIYAALIVLVPIIIPLGAAFGIDPVHLGIIFLVNMEIGFLTPPMGLNLFLSAYCFKKPIGSVYRASIPFYVIQIGILFLITYMPYIFNAVRGLFGYSS